MPQVGRGKLCPTIPQRHADSSKMQTYFPNSVIPTPSGLVNEKTVEIRDQCINVSMYPLSSLVTVVNRVTAPKCT